MPYTIVMFCRTVQQNSRLLMGTPGFITVLTTARHWILYSIHSILHDLITRIIFGELLSSLLLLPVSHCQVSVAP